MIHPSSERPRIALYSHDTMGLGHVRRNLLIGGTLASSRLKPNVLLLSGAVDAKSFHIPEGVDLVTLPSLYKEADGSYKSRRLRMPLDEIISLRGKILLSSIEAFDPNIFIVDTAPWGVSGELESVLEYLSAEGRSSLVLGMRDIWDEPSTIAREWAAKDNWEAIRRHYDQVWVYGDPFVYDAISEYRVAKDIVHKFRYTGYLGRTADHVAQGADYAAIGTEMTEAPMILCLMGGGQDGMKLAEAFLQCRLPKGRKGILVTGPFMDPVELQRLRKQVSGSGRFRVVDFIPEPISLVHNAEAVISMGGYNAVSEIVSFGRPALIVPRVRPRTEQLIRSERFKGLGLLELLHPQDLKPDAITAFLRSLPHPRRSTKVDMGGLVRVNEFVEQLLSRRFVGPDEKSAQRI